MLLYTHVRTQQGQYFNSIYSNFGESNISTSYIQTILPMSITPQVQQYHNRIALNIAVHYYT